MHLNTIGSKIKYLRKNMSLSRAKFSEISGINQNTLRSWEQDKRKVSSANLIKIVDVAKNHWISLDLDWLNDPDNDTLGLHSEISNHIIYHDRIFKKAQERTTRLLDTKKNKYSLQEVICEVKNQYEKILLGKDKES